MEFFVKLWILRPILASLELQKRQNQRMPSFDEGGVRTKKAILNTEHLTKNSLCCNSF